jgi:hypothetical protein
MSDYIKEVKKVIEDAEKNYQKEANLVFRELNKFLIIIATSIFSFSLFIFQNEELIIKLKYLNKIFLIIFWGILAVSIISGGIQFIIEYLFFKKWKETHSKILSKLSKINNEEKIDDLVVCNMIIQQQENIPTESNRYCIYIQFFTLGIAFIILIYFMVQVLF